MPLKGRGAKFAVSFHSASAVRRPERSKIRPYSALTWLHRYATRRFSLLASPSYTVLSALTVTVVTLARLAATLVACRSFCRPRLSAFRRRHPHSISFAVRTRCRLNSTVRSSGGESHGTRRGRCTWRTALRLVVFVATAPAWRKKLPPRALCILSFCSTLSLGLLQDDAD